MLKVENVSFDYGWCEESVFKNFSLELQSDCIYGLLGKNGAGKSTLLYLMCGLLRPQEGRVTFDGLDVSQRRAEVLNEIFLVPEEFELPHVSMAEYVKLNRPFYPHFSDSILAECMKDFELEADLNLGKLSMGQKKKAYMCFALAANTRYLIMDEPTNGLDIPAKSQFRKVLSRHMEEGRTLLISTHQVQDVDTLLDHVCVIDSSRVLLDSSVNEICSRFKFELRPVGSDVSDALYVQPSLMGNAVISSNMEQKETPLNLELLFNALIENPELIK